MDVWNIKAALTSNFSKTHMHTFLICHKEYTYTQNLTMQPLTTRLYVDAVKVEFCCTQCIAAVCVWPRDVPFVVTLHCRNLRLDFVKQQHTINTSFCCFSHFLLLSYIKWGGTLRRRAKYKILHLQSVINEAPRLLNNPNSIMVPDKFNKSKQDMDLSFLGGAWLMDYSVK